MKITNIAMVVAALLAGQALANDPHAPDPAADSVPAVTPDQALQQLTEGNLRFQSSMSEHPHLDQDRRCLTFTGGQHPVAAVLSCSDSRAPVELLFDQGVGDLFTIRVAGNVADVDEIATIEYGVGHLHTPLIVVLGHTKCGAVTAVVDGAQLHGNLELLTDNIKPAAAAAKQAHPNLNGPALVSQAIQANVWQSVADLLAKSDEVRAAVQSGQVKIIGAVYDIHAGAVQWLGEHPQQSALLAGQAAPASSHDAVHAAPAAAQSHDAHDSQDSHDASDSHDPHAPADHPKTDSHGGASRSEHDAHSTDEHTDAHATAEKPMAASHQYMILAAFLAGSGTASGLVLRMMKKKKAEPSSGENAEPAA